MRRLVLICMLSVMGLSGCTHKGLGIGETVGVTLRVAFDWQDAPEADPAGMCVFFVPTGEGRSYRFDLRGTEGGEVKVAAGSYNVLCYNNDTEAVLFHNTDRFHEHYATTRSGNMLEAVYGNAASYLPKSESAKEQDTRISPDMLWGSSVKDVKIRQQDMVLTLYPHDLVCTYTYEVRNVSNLENVSMAFGTITGLSAGLMLAEEKLDRMRISLPFSGQSDGMGSLVGEFLTFGRYDDEEIVNRMTFYFYMTDGRKFAFGVDGGEKFNVTSQITGAPDRRHVHIIIDGLDIPAVIRDNDPYEVGVEDWNVVNEDLYI